MAKKLEQNKKYDKLEVVNVRLVKEPSILSDKPIASPNDAVDVIAKFISQFDREVVCVLNLATDGTPINMNMYRFTEKILEYGVPDDNFVKQISKTTDYKSMAKCLAERV